MAGRRSRLVDSDYAKAIAEGYVAGTPMGELAEELGIPESTLRIYIKDPRVQAHARTIAIERVQRITRKIDGEIEARLAHISDWALDEILKVRKEYLDRPLKVGAGEDVDLSKATNELSEAMDQSPELARQLMELVSGNKNG